MLSPLLQIPGVLSAFVTDDSGHLMASAGTDLPPTAGVLVLAHATISAASELGRRSGSGDCEDLVQHHEGGLVMLRSLPQRQALIVRCQHGTDVQQVRQTAATLAWETVRAQPPRRFIPSGAMSLEDALHAMPAW